MALRKYIQIGRSDLFFEDALGDLGLVSEKLNNIDDAIHHYESYLKLFPEGKRWSEINVYLGKLLLSKSRYGEGREALSRALADRTHFLALEAQYLVGQAFFSEGRYEDAIRSFLKTQLYKDGVLWQSKGLLRIGYCHRELKRFDRARHYLDKVLSKYPGTEAAKEAIEALRDLPKS
jgi:TolA-binding protein